MHTFLLVLTIHGLLLGFGFLIAGYATLLGAEEEEERLQYKKDYDEARREGWLKVWACYQQFRRDFTGTRRLGKNWRERPTAHKCIYAGVAFFALAAVLGFPLGAYK